MEFIEYKCPFCNETMQVPSDRRRIKCMFCGKDIVLHLGEGTDIGDFDSEYCRRILRESIPPVIEARERYHARFNKKEYKASFHDFEEEFALFLEVLDSAVLCNAAGLKEAGVILEEFSEELAIKAVEIALSDPKKKKRSFDNEILNLYMVCYVLPSIKEKGPDHMDDILESICDSWREHVPLGNIQPSSYEDLANGFKKGIFGLFRGKI